MTTVRCEKIGPMQWRIYAPGREPFDYWVYALVVNDLSHNETFDVEVDLDNLPRTSTRGHAPLKATP